jgi:hypothetical protein
MSQARIDPLAPLLDLIRKEAATAAVDAVRAEMQRERLARTEGPRLLSLNAIAKQYGCGREVTKQLIREGRLPALERRCRGGHIGTYCTREDVERVLAGRKP